MLDLSPTSEAYTELQTAYDFINSHLFQGALPPCLLTLQRKSSRVRGYFSPGRFDGENGRKTDELAMNPQHFRRRKTEEVLSTLGHEMVHVWQEHFGKPGRGGYHNKQWAQKMKEVGLYPSNSGELGGKETGDQMTHYIVSSGPFDVAIKDLLASGFRLSWSEGDGMPGGPDPDGDGDLAAPSPPKNKSNRIKYRCSSCNTNAWGKPGLKLVCGSCTTAFIPV